MLSLPELGVSASGSGPSKPPNAPVTAVKRIRRTRDGCLPCRSFKKGCTKEKPSCSRCVRLGYKCQYPSANVPAPRVGSKIPLERTDDPPKSPTQEALAAFDEPDIVSPGVDGSLQSMNYDPFFSALTHSICLPHMAHNHFRLHMNPPVPQEWPTFRFSDLAPTIFDKQENHAWLSSLYTQANWLYARPDVLLSLYSGLGEQLKTRTLQAAIFGDVFISSQTRLIPLAKLFREDAASIPPEADAILQQRAVSRENWPDWGSLEDMAWRAFADTARPLEQRLARTQDQSYWALYAQGAAAFDRYQDAMMGLVLSCFGPQETFDLGDLSIVSFYITSNVIWADILQSVTRYRPPSYNYLFQRCNVVTTGLEVIIGAPNEVAVCLAGISRMASEFNPAHAKSIVFTEEQLAQIELMEQSIIAIPQDLIITSKDSVLNISQLACQEVWRQGTYIHYHQALLCHSAEHPQIQAALSTILKLLKVVELELEPSLHGPLALPIWLAATVALNPDDRDQCRYWMSELGSKGVLFQEAMAVAELVWTKTDQDGSPVDFRDLVIETGLKVSFF